MTSTDAISPLGLHQAWVTQYTQIHRAGCTLGKIDICQFSFELIELISFLINFLICVCVCMWARARAYMHGKTNLEHYSKTMKQNKTPIVQNNPNVYCPDCGSYFIWICISLHNTVHFNPLAFLNHTFINLEKYYFGLVNKKFHY